MKRTVLSLFGIIYFMYATSQTEINYRHKTLIRSLEKEGITDISAIKEYAIPDSISSQQSIHGKYFQVDSSIASQCKYIYIGRVNSCRAGGCSNTNYISEEGTSEYFDYFILFDNKKSVQLVNVFNYQSTHGQEVTAKGWLKQFIGHNGSEPLRVDKNIDGIAGATVSVYAIIHDVELKTEILHELRLIH